MPLNRELGEKLEGMDGQFRVVHADKYKSLPRLTTTVKEWSGNKFKIQIDVERPVWEAALGHAQISFYEKGAPPSLNYDVIAQEYPKTNTLVFIFNAVIAGQEHYVVAPFALANEQIADLMLRDLW